MPRELTITEEQELAHPPERVWRAIATGAGNLGWLYPMEVEPGVGGAVSRGGAEVVEWEPPHRFACRAGDGNGFSTTLSYRLDGVGGGVRLRAGIHWVHEGEPDEGWEARGDAAARYAGFYHHSLAEYLGHFDGRPATYVRAARERVGTGQLGIVADALGLARRDVAGCPVRLAPVGLEPLEGVLDYRDEDFIGVRTPDGLYRFFGGDRWRWPTWVAHHLFAPGVDGEAEARRWQAWLDGLPEHAGGEVRG
ncbi:MULTISPECIES: SRPBCC family protein [Actinosynnema]|uniref:ATPase n=1 Tax=Actinosynnema pretiosum TaxID=42197 RepID=A0A290Z7J7_9PSEU|nr:SRPBCC domain-containing protein [Actinosynnema pretiosum]ATE54978.1 ATPase [Actinosynnema pretiosum]